MTRDEILETARAAVSGDRDMSYGSPEDSFEAISRLWAALDGRDMTPVQVALYMIGLKCARAMANPDHLDNWIDVAGYAACGGEIASRARDA